MDNPLKIFEIPIDQSKSVFTMPAPICAKEKVFYRQDLKKLKIDRIVCLLSPMEIKVHGLEGAEKAYKEFGIAYLNFPITDFGTPRDQASFLQLVKDLKAQIILGENLCIHCKAGIGRSSLLAAAILLSFGHNKKQVFDYISKHRKEKVPDKQSQIDWLMENASNFE